MDVTDLLTPVALKRVENMIINRTNIRIKHTKFKKHIPKIKYCRKYKNVTSYNYYYNDINDKTVGCAIKGNIRYAMISGDTYAMGFHKMKYLKKDIPYSLKIKLLNIIKNRYLISKLKMLSYKYKYRDINDNKIYKTNQVLYYKNIIFLFLAKYLNTLDKYNNINKAYVFLMNSSNNTTLYDFFVSIIEKHKITNPFYIKYIKNTNIQEIIHEHATPDLTTAYNKFITVLKKYDNYKLMKQSMKIQNSQIIKILTKVLYSKKFHEFVIIESSNLQIYKFDTKYYRNRCKKAGILSEYEEMIKSIDAGE
jgi:hypothetical protein